MRKAPLRAGAGSASMLSIMIATGFVSGTALAASSADAQPATQSAVGPAATGTDTVANDTQIQDIIVSARRRDESLQQTPISITAITPRQLEAKATLNIGDLQGAAPNVLITNQNTGSAAANVSIRGLAFADNEKSFESTVAIVVDGAGSSDRNPERWQPGRRVLGESQGAGPLH